jgi:Ca2+-transporting ATPase
LICPPRASRDRRKPAEQRHACGRASGLLGQERHRRRLRSWSRPAIGGLFGYIATFLGASIFNVAKGIPLLPLQTLWVSFTMLSIQSVGLGYSKPAAGLMDRPPLPPTKPILTRGLIIWLAFVGLVMTVGTLSVISWAEHMHGLAIARTMGMVTFALFLLFFSVESKDQRDSAFSLDTFSDKTFVVTTGGSFVLLILSWTSSTRS